MGLKRIPLNPPALTQAVHRYTPRQWAKYAGMPYSRVTRLIKIRRFEELMLPAGGRVEIMANNRYEILIPAQRQPDPHPRAAWLANAKALAEAMSKDPHFLDMVRTLHLMTGQILDHIEAPSAAAQAANESA